MPCLLSSKGAELTDLLEQLVGGGGISANRGGKPASGDPGRLVAFWLASWLPHLAVHCGLQPLPRHYNPTQPAHNE